MQTFKKFFSLLFIGFLSSSLFAQSSAAFHSLIYPHSITAAALGEQGVVARNGLAAMQYNPANLVYTDGISFSFFRNPWNILGWGMPLIAANMVVKLGNTGSVGVEYTYWNFGEFDMVTEVGLPTGESFHYYERSIAGGYAMPLSDQLAIGAQIRYVWQPQYRHKNIDHILFSTGVSYQPEILSNRLSCGLSLMNFGTRIEYHSSLAKNTVSSDPPPAQINMGIEGLIITNEYFNLSLALGAMKPLDKRNTPPDYSAQSSFKSLFNNWSDFPEDVTVHAGLGFIWHPVYLGVGISFFQEMYLGYFSTGPKDISKNFYTHGLKMGLTAYGVTATAGYAGRWHNNNADSYLPWEFPWETFQFDLSTDMNILGTGRAETTLRRILHGTILSCGYAFGLAVGKMKEMKLEGASVSFSMNNVWSVEADFYIDENAAIVSSLAYSRMTENFTVNQFVSSPDLPFGIDFGIETLSLASGFRYHPIDAFHPFFIQASLGIIRMNPVDEYTYPRYFYRSFSKMDFGVVFAVNDLGIIVMPEIGLRTLFMSEYSNSSQLAGYNQFEFGLNVGYKF